MYITKTRGTRQISNGSGSESPIADQYTYLGVEISKECSWDAHVAKVIGKGKAHVGKMDATLTDSQPDTRIKR